MVALLLATAAWASRGFPEPFTVTQPDGSQITVVLLGDEQHHWLQTTDGVMVVNTGRGYFVAEVDDQGRLRASSVLAHEAKLRLESETAVISRQQERRELFRQQSAHGQHRAAIATPSSPYLPHQGSPRILVILAAFQDVPFTVGNPQQSFGQFLSGEEQADLGHKEDKNTNSVMNYFKAVSQGQFTPQIDLAGPVTVSQNMAYYGADENVTALAQEAVEQLDGQVDFSQYDNDGDGTVEAVYIIHAGYGENIGAPSDALWAKTTTASVNTADGVKIGRFCLSSELNGSGPEAFSDGIPWINGIGVFVHELSHAMGLPDMYPVSESSKALNNQCMECWDLMDMGEYVSNGYTPAPYTAWEQETMGWLEITELKESQEGLTLKPVVEGGKAYKFGNGADPEEFIVVENIQRRGLHAKAYGHGLLVYHVAYKSSSVNMGDYPNDVAGKPRMTVVPADGLLLSYNQVEGRGYGGTYTQKEYQQHHAGDPFPGTSNVTQLTDEMALPNYCFYNGSTQTGFSLQNIKEDTETGNVTFDFVREGTLGISVNTQDSNAHQPIYSLDGRYVGTDIHRLPRGLYIRNGQKLHK